MNVKMEEKGLPTINDVKSNTYVCLELAIYIVVINDLKYYCLDEMFTEQQVFNSTTSRDHQY